MNATPETFKPGERWLSRKYGSLAEIVCVEWSPSGKAVLFYFPNSGGDSVRIWREPEELGCLLERLPDVESGNYQTGQARGVEEAGASIVFSLWPCICAHCCDTKAQIKEAIKIHQRHEAAAQKIKAHAESINNETR